MIGFYERGSQDPSNGTKVSLEFAWNFVIFLSIVPSPLFFNLKKSWFWVHVLNFLMRSCHLCTVGYARFESINDWTSRPKVMLTHLTLGTVVCLNLFFHVSSLLGSSTHSLRLLWTEFGISSVLLLVFLVYFPERPPKPPSVTSGFERMAPLQSLKAFCMWVPSSMRIGFSKPSLFIIILPWYHATGARWPGRWRSSSGCRWDQTATSRQSWTRTCNTSASQRCVVTRKRHETR